MTTQEQAREMALVMMAFAEGKEIEWHHKAELTWYRHGVRDPIWNWDHFDYRIKPVPKTRPWRQEDVPPVCWVRQRIADDGRDFNGDWRAVIFIGRVGVGTGADGEELLTYGVLCREYEFSVDLKTWKKCEVEE